MKHTEILLLPLMMIADYLLTVHGAVQREKKYSMHFKTEHYELNPIWQEQIAKKKRYSLRHFLLTVLISGSLIYLLESEYMPHGFAQVLLGCLLVFYGMILGKHFSNLLTFSHLTRNPGKITGEVTMSHELTLFLSLYHTVVFVIPITLVAVFSQNNFARGGALGVILFIVIHFIWIRKAKKTKA